MTARIAMAVIGGYALSAVASAALALALPVERSTATLAATMLSFLLYGAVLMWAFYCRPLRTVLLGIPAMAAVLALTLPLLRNGAVP